MIRYESGINRLADLNLLDGDRKDEKLINFGHKFGGLTEIFSPRSVKYVEIMEEWEMFKIKFTLFYPFDLKEDETFHLTIDRLG